MRARLAYLHSPDVWDLPSWVPDDPDVFGFLLECAVGPVGEEGINMFDVMVCSPAWFALRMTDTGIRSGQHTIFMTRYDHRVLVRYVERCVHACEAETWVDLAAQLGRIACWEFDGYMPYVPSEGPG